jgi:hypothetical protein
METIVALQGGQAQLGAVLRRSACCEGCPERARFDLDNSIQSA